MKEEKYLKPATTKEAFALVEEHREKFSFLAGGTDMMILRRQKINTSECLIDLSAINEMKEISFGKKFLRIGGLVTLDEISKNEKIKNEFPLLCEATDSVASPTIRKSATIAGNILCENRCFYYNQSEFWRTAINFCLKCHGDVCHVSNGKNVCYARYVSDTAPALICLGASLIIENKDGERTVPLEKFFTGDGIKPNNLKKGEIIKTILIPLNQSLKTFFRKLRVRKSVDFTSLTVAVSCDNKEKIKIALSGVSMEPVIVEENIKLIPREKIIDKVLKKCKIVENDFLPMKYRKEMVKVFLFHAL